jgi:hypothetical protein
VNCSANSNAQPAYNPTLRVHSRLPRSTTHHSVPSAASIDGSRNAMRQLPNTVNPAACNHISIGGLSEYSSVPRCGNSQLPLSTICLATSANRGSSAGHGSRRPSPAPSTSSATIQNNHVSREARVFSIRG